MKPKTKSGQARIDILNHPELTWQQIQEKFGYSKPYIQAVRRQKEKVKTEFFEHEKNAFYC